MSRLEPSPVLDLSDPAPRSVAELEEQLSRPSEPLIQALGRLDGDLVVLGAAGKMGPTMARMALRASRAAGNSRRVWAVSRFQDASVAQRMRQWGLEIVPCDLLERSAVAQLPEAPWVVYLAGFKFGAQAQAAYTWAMNGYLPALVAERYQHSRIAAVSSGNVYGLTPVGQGGSRETDPPDPHGEYAMSVLARERMFEYFSLSQETPVTILRLNYACELRYGVLVDLAERVLHRQPVSLEMGHVNVIWQRDANEMILAGLEQAARPARILNVAGGQTLAVADLAAQLGELLGRPVQLEGTPSTTALLSDARLGHQLLGAPAASLPRMLEWTAEWIRRGGSTLGKPTHFQVRDGQF